MKVIIIGGVAGGASSAARLRRLNEKAEIIMLEKGENISFANCGLPYYVGGEIDNEAALSLHTPESFNRRFNIDVRILSEAIEIDPEKKQVTILDHKNNMEYLESFDSLILSPGAKPIVPSKIESTIEGVFTIRTIPDIKNVKKFIDNKKPKTAVVVGGGYIGIEMAENLHKANIGVTIVELGDHIITPLDFDVSCDVYNYMVKNGFDIRLNTAVVDIEKHTAGFCVKLLNDECLSADIVILAVGVKPDTEFLKGSNIKLNERGSIITDSFMRTNYKYIYAVGDAAQVQDFNTGKPAFIPLAGPANKQGRIAADNICGIRSEYKGTQGSSIIKVLDMTVACTGLNERTAKLEGIEHDKIYLYSASHATYYPGAKNMAIKVVYQKGSGRILGAQIVGYDGVDKRCDVLATAIRFKLTASDLKDLELCYAPPYSSAKDPVNMVGFIIDNLLQGKVKNFYIEDIDSLPNDGSVHKIDVREVSEYQRGFIDGFVNIPLSKLRENINALEKGKPVYINCQSGLRSYIASRIFSENGFETYNLSGGYRLYDAVCNRKCLNKDKNCAGKEYAK